jgi:hypothetical protein
MKNNRKILLINPAFQIRFIAMIIGLSLAVSLINLAGFSYFIFKLHELGLSIGLDSSHPYFKFILRQQQNLWIIYAVSTLCIFIILTIFSLLFSHKIAGPIHGLKVYLGDIAAGKPPRNFAFRKGDFFTELPELVNKAVKTLNEKNKEN